MKHFHGHKVATMIGTFLAAGLFTAVPALAAGTGASGSSGVGAPIKLNPISTNGVTITQAANNILSVMDGFGLFYLQVAVAIGITIFALIGVIKASKDKNPKAMWTEIAFSLAGIVLVLNPILLIEAALSIGSWISGLQG